MELLNTSSSVCHISVKSIVWVRFRSARYSYHYGGCFIPVNIAWKVQLKAPNQAVGLDAGLFEVNIYSIHVLYCSRLCMKTKLQLRAW